MKTNKFTSSVENVFNKNTNSKNVLKNEPQGLVIRYDTESQKKEKIIDELKSFISNSSRISSHLSYDERVSTLVFNISTAEINVKTLSRLVYFYNLTNPDNFERFKKNVDDGYLLLMLLNMRTVVSYSKVPEDTRELQTKGIKNFSKLFTRKQWKNLISSEPIYVFNFESLISEFITSSFSETFFEDNADVRFYFELLKSALDYETLTYKTRSAIKTIADVTTPRLRNQISLPQFRTLDEFVVGFYGSIDIFTGLLSLYTRLSPDLTMHEVGDHINLMSDIRRFNKDIKFHINPKWSLQRFRKEHHDLVTILNDLKSEELSKMPIINLKFINYKNLNNVVLTNDKGVDYEVSIKLLNSQLELHKETNIMKHCVSNYFSYVKALNYLVFSITTKNFENDRYTLGLAANFKSYTWGEIKGRDDLYNPNDREYRFNNEIKDFSLEQVKGKLNDSVSEDFPLDKLLEVLYKVVNTEEFISYLNGRKIYPLTKLKVFENEILSEKKMISFKGVKFDGPVTRSQLYVFKNNPIKHNQSFNAFKMQTPINPGVIPDLPGVSERSFTNQLEGSGFWYPIREERRGMLKQYLDLFLKSCDVFYSSHIDSGTIRLINKYVLKPKQIYEVIHDLCGNNKPLNMTTVKPLIRVTKFLGSTTIPTSTLVDILIDGV